jgi:hemolysin activation/secretion protein
MFRISWLIGLTGLILFLAGTVKAESSETTSGGKKLYYLDKVFVEAFELTGNTIFSSQELTHVVASYQHREITLDELLEVKTILTNYYVAHGYINSGVEIPDQLVEKGRIRLSIVEGRLSDIHVRGNRRLHREYISDRLSLATENGKKPLNIYTMQQQLRIMKTDPRIESIQARIKPGMTPGEAVMDVTVEEASPYKVKTLFNNHNSPSTGSNNTGIALDHINLTGRGDALHAEAYLLTEGHDRYGAYYETPITPRDAKLTLKLDHAVGKLMEKPFRVLDIESETDAYTLDFRYPLVKRQEKDLLMGVTLSTTENRIVFSDEPIDLFPGSENGKVRITAIRFYLEAIFRKGFHILAARSRFSKGVPLLNASTSEEEPNVEFFAWLGEGEWLMRLPWFASTLSTRMSIQLTGEPLLSFEKFSIGGATSVRGYREGESSGDNGLNTTIEWRVPLGDLRLPYLKRPLSVMGIPFIDFGKCWDYDASFSDMKSLFSLGSAMRFMVGDNFRADLCWGKAIREVDEYPEYNLQDDGIYFQVVIGY